MNQRRWSQGYICARLEITTSSSSKAAGSTCIWGPDAASPRGGSRPGPMAEVDPDQEAALRRLRAAFGFIEILRIVDHDDGQDQDDDEPTEEGEPPAPA
jgi:hypothetical protein